MARYQVILAYDGTEFRGFQRQTKARTVQGVVENALRELNWQGKSLLAAGRTDTGVHASGQVIAFDLDWSHSSEDLCHALNTLLPGDVAAREARPVRVDFHPRYEAVSRCYHYRLFCDAIRDPLRERFDWRVWPPVDAGAMREASSLLLGQHDFVAFGTPPRPEGSTIRTVNKAEWVKEGSILVFEVVADAFLYHMVRRMVALLVRIGRADLRPEDILDFLPQPIAGERREPPLVMGLAPAQGLILREVRYE